MSDTTGTAPIEVPFFTETKICTKCNKEKGLLCCFREPTRSWCTKCRSVQQQTREETKRSKYFNNLTKINTLQSQNTALEKELAELTKWKEEVKYYTPHIDKNVAQSRNEIKELKEQLAEARGLLDLAFDAINTFELFSNSDLVREMSAYKDKNNPDTSIK